MEWLKLRGRPVSDWSQWFVMLLVGLLVSIFASTIINFAPVSAADAEWDGAQLVYNGETYAPINNSAELQNLGLSEGGRSYGVSSTVNGVQEFRVITFPSIDDIATATSAEYVVYNVTSPNTFTRKSSATISTEPAGENSGNLSGGLEQGTSCDVKGIGWALCPVSNWLANGMDWLYDKLTGFLVSQPLNITDRTSGQYIAWKIMLNIANALFIVVFIIIIYSQITSFGISNYGIKKMLPRLIIAAIMVNISFYICALAIDLSNITGHAIQDMFIQIRNTMATVGSSNSSATYTWESVTAAVLAGTAAAGAAGGTFVVAYAGVSSSALIMLLPLLVGLLMTIIVVLLVLAARQALIVILTIISPLAFVCYLLPGTEKWFEKWRNLFFTMLIFFPAFSAVFGGAQLAGAAILQNATSIIMVILGLGVQIAPLAIAPLILKLSGGLLNRFAGIINNPSKGMVDRTRKWAEGRSQYLANKRSRGNNNLRRWNVPRRLGRYAHRRSSLMKDRAADAEKRAENSYHEWEKYKKQDLINRNTNRRAEQISQQSEADYGIARAGQLTPEMQAMQRKWVRGIRADKEMSRVFAEMQTLENNVALEGMRKSSAQRVLSKQLADNFNANTPAGIALRQAAGRPEDIFFGGDRGSQRVLAETLQTVHSADEDSIKNAEIIITHSNLDDTDLVKMSQGISRRGITVTDDIRAASIRKILGGGNANAINQLLNEVDFDNLPADFHQEMGIALLGNPSARPPWVGGSASSQIKSGTTTGSGRDFIMDAMRGSLQKLSAEKLVTTDQVYLDDLTSKLQDTTFRNSLSPAIKNNLREQIELARTNELYSGRIGERRESINNIFNLL
jgi:hypothetical protein